MADLLDLPGQAGALDRIAVLFAERPRLAVVAAVPRSGSSKLLADAAAAADGRVLVVDARPCVDTRDLADALSDAAIGRAAPALLSWWRSGVFPEDRDAIDLSRRLLSAGLDLEVLRSREPSGTPRDQLAESLLLAAALQPQATVVIDHLGEVLAGLPANEADHLASDLRAFAQGDKLPALVLVDAPGAYLTGALGNDQHALYAAGPIIKVDRPALSAFTVDVNDPVLARSVSGWPDAARIAFALSDGAPALGWQILSLAKSLDCDVHDAHQRLLELNAQALSVQWTMLRRVHPRATSVAACLADELPTSRVSANRKSINDALARMRGLRIAWQPRPGEWRLADTLLAAYLKRHRPPWIAAQLSV